MINDLISRSEVIEELKYLKHIGYDNSGVMKLQNMEIQRCISVIEDAPTVEVDPFKEKVIELFNKYDVLILHIGDKLEPVRNTSKQDCYNLLFDIGELIDWRSLLFKKYHGGEE